jgi:hypothetical protein
VKNLILISNPLIVKGDEEFGKRKGLFQVPSFSDPLGIRIEPFLLAKYQALSSHYQGLPIFSCSVLFE